MRSAARTPSKPPPKSIVTADTGAIVTRGPGIVTTPATKPQVPMRTGVVYSGVTSCLTADWPALKATLTSGPVSLSHAMTIADRHRRERD